MERFTGPKSTTPGKVGPPSIPSSPVTPQRPTTVRADAMTNAERQLAPYIQTLTSRLEALEATVRGLQERSVQQLDDGKLCLPAGNKLKIETGNTRLTMDVRKFTVEANGQVILAAPAIPLGPPTHAPGSVQGIAAQAGVGHSWSSVAQQNAIANPRKSTTP
jgi:hypothetical protein